jgi:hypothetical protein
LQTAKLQTADADTDALDDWKTGARADIPYLALTSLSHDGSQPGHLAFEFFQTNFCRCSVDSILQNHPTPPGIKFFFIRMTRYSCA